MKTKLVFLLSVLLVVVSCGEGPADQPAAEAVAKAPTAPPSLDVAAEVIAKSGPFSEFKFTRTGYGFPTEGARLKGDQLDAVKDLKAAGWVDIDPDGDVTLTIKGGKNKRFIVRPNRTIEIVPLATKEFISADAAGHDKEGDVTIDFTWRWVPIDVHAAFKHGKIVTRFEGVQKARATMYESMDGWEILRIVEIEQEEPAAEAETASEDG